jgi:negative regulator of flagellin synthesis FlgM
MVSEVKGPGGSIKGVGGQPAAVERRTQTAQAPSSQARSAGGGSDKVTLTELSTRLQALVKSIELLPVVDRQRVAEIQQALRDGSYEIDAPAIAAKLLAFERMLAEHVKLP